LSQTTSKSQEKREEKLKALDPKRLSLPLEIICGGQADLTEGAGERRRETLRVFNKGDGRHRGLPRGRIGGGCMGKRMIRG